MLEKINSIHSRYGFLLIEKKLIHEHSRKQAERIKKVEKKVKLG